VKQPPCGGLEDRQEHENGLLEMIAEAYSFHLSITLWPTAAGIALVAIVVWWFVFRKGS
jgi:hypothetical protein